MLVAIVAVGCFVCFVTVDSQLRVKAWLKLGSSLAVLLASTFVTASDSMFKYPESAELQVRHPDHSIGVPWSLAIVVILVVLVLGGSPVDDLYRPPQAHLNGDHVGGGTMAKSSHQPKVGDQRSHLGGISCSRCRRQYRTQNSSTPMCLPAALLPLIRA
ncbi:hypothetical protein MTO96_004818 [Rhipicephalus appendiculatus]